MTVVWILAALFGLVALVMGSGHLLPATYRGSATTDVPASAASTFRLALDGTRQPVGMRVRGVAPLPDVEGRPSWVEDLGSTRVTVVVASAAGDESPRRIDMRLTDAEAPVSAEFMLEIEGDDGAAACRATASFEIHIATSTWHGPLFRWAMKLGGGARSSARNYARRLAAAAAAGDAAAVAPMTPAVAPGPPATVRPGEEPTAS